MERSPASEAELLVELNDLRSRVAEAEEVVRAIRSGEVDAFFVTSETGRSVCALDGTESAFRVLVEAMNEGAGILTEAGVVLYCNGRFAEMLNAPLESVMGASVFRFVAGREHHRFAKLHKQGLGVSCTAEMELECGDGTTIPTKLSFSAVEIHKQPCVSLIATDLTYRKRAEEEREKLQSISLTDELTGLANRRGFMSLARQQMKVARRMKVRQVLLFMDLDNLKDINDSLGHKQGDRALSDAADVLREAFRDSDVMSRLGGDEFAVLATIADEKDSQVLLERLQADLDAHNARNRRPYQLTLSVGVAHYDPRNSIKLNDLLVRADTAMYEQKRRKRVLRAAQELDRSPPSRHPDPLAAAE